MQDPALEHPGFWARNGAELQTFSTMALILVTGVYVAFTGLIAKASGQQASTARDQVKAAKDELEAGGGRFACAHSSRFARCAGAV